MEKYICTNCENEVSDELDFCPFCGNLFLEEANCKNHPSQAATGACLICEEPYCDNCGGYVNEKFLCTTHENYEIYEGMAKVFGSNDYVHCNYIADILKQEKIDAIVYSRKVSPMHLGGTDYSLFRASGDFNGHIINEIKVMVPFADVIRAEEIIKEFETTE